MKLMQREKQESPSGDFVALYNRWKQTAALIVQNRMLKLKWPGFAEKILRNLLPLKQYMRKPAKMWINQNPYRFDLIKGRTQNQRPKKKHLIENESVHFPKAYSEIDKKKDSFEKKAEKSSYFYLDSSLRNFLARILNIHIPSVKIYANQASDTLAKQFNADALTHGNNIFFKTDRYDPRDKRGIALLGHELTHAVQAKAQNLPEPAVTGYRHEEQQAMDNEKKVLNYFSAIERYDGDKDLLNYSSIDNYSKEYRSDSGTYKSYESPVSLDTPGNSTNTGQLNHTQTRASRTALTSRDLNLSSETNVNLNSAFQLSEQQLRMIKDDIYRDIMNRIRIEFERGG
ncbi:MAG: DUF4157 domain-containing protein [Methanosarcina sp.]|jgi:hypothetical protein